MFLNFRINITDSLTISGLASKIFRRYHYEPENIPLITNKKYYQDIKQAYYGGCTEVYRPTGNNLFYHDVNSLYPYVALNNPLPGLGCTYIEYLDSSFTANIENLFGFYYCSIDTTNTSVKYLGLLPYRTKDKGLLFPLVLRINEKIDTSVKN